MKLVTVAKELNQPFRLYIRFSQQNGVRFPIGSQRSKIFEDGMRIPRLGPLQTLGFNHVRRSIYPHTCYAERQPEIQNPVHLFLHVGAPPSPVSYYQQVGRAGRAIDHAHAVLLPSDSDTGVWDYFATATIPVPDQVRRVLAVLPVEEPETPPVDGSDGYTEDEIIQIIYAAADQYGQPREDMLRVARCESVLDPNAVNASSNASGLFQFLPSTWATTPYADQDIFDPVANAEAAAWMWDNGRRGEWTWE